MKYYPRTLALAGAMAFASASQAATPVEATIMTSGVPVTGKVQVQGWLNDNFGIQGWTHFSKWGQFTARKAQRVKITIDSATAGAHPGVSVWWRKTGRPFAPVQREGVPKSNYYQSHAYNQYDTIKAGVMTDEVTNAVVGALEMIIATNGYDADGVTTQYAANANLLNPVKDGIPGHLELQFNAPYTGTYQLVTGGAFPDSSICQIKAPITTPCTFANQAEFTYQVDIGR
jgi:hypothetical protein